MFTRLSNCFDWIFIGYPKGTFYKSMAFTSHNPTGKMPVTLIWKEKATLVCTKLDQADLSLRGVSRAPLTMWLCTMCHHSQECVNIFFKYQLRCMLSTGHLLLTS